MSETDPTWVAIDKTWREFRSESGYNQPLLKAGVVLEIRYTDGEIKRELVGDINTLGGYCDDCSINDKAVVLRALDLSSRLVMA